MQCLQVPSNDRIPVLWKRGSEHGKFCESLPSTGLLLLTRRGPSLLGWALFLHQGRDGAWEVSRRGTGANFVLLRGLIWVPGVCGVVCFSSAITAGSPPCPHSTELAHDQFQNATFVCQTCTAVIGLLLVCCMTCHLLAPFPEKKSGDRS